MKWLPRGFSSMAEGRGQVEKQVKTPSPQVQVQIEPSEAEGIYANLVLIAHSASEFILDFARILPGVSRAKVYSRIIITPRNARALLQALERRIESYETQFGKIPTQSDTSPSRDIGFTTDAP